MFSARRHSAPLAVVLALYAATAAALSPVYLECQHQKPAGVSVLSSCPVGTIYVAQNDSQAQFTSVQAAVDSLCVSFLLIPPGMTFSPAPARRHEGIPATILIGAGEYHETLNVTRKAPLTLLVRIAPALSTSDLSINVARF